MPHIRRIRYTFSSFGYTSYTSTVHGNIYSVHMETIKKGSSSLFIYMSCSACFRVRTSLNPGIILPIDRSS